MNIDEDEDEDEDDDDDDDDCIDGMNKKRCLWVVVVVVVVVDMEVEELVVECIDQSTIVGMLPLMCIAHVAPFLSFLKL